MDPITIGVAIAGAKKLLEVSSDIKDVAGALDNIFHLTSKAEKTKKSKVDESDTSYKSVIHDVVTERNNQTLLRNLEIDVDEKFGFGTWNAIKLERERRMELAKEQKIKEAKKLKAKKEAEKEFYERVFYWLKELGKLILILGVAGGFAYVIYVNRCLSGNC
tara:strand:- start:194 stop:679 length:486 start_codon:yes stop_codon:yes gene_type:complete